MNYQEVIDFLFNQFPMFEKTPGEAYKPGLDRIKALCLHFDNPHFKTKFIHVAGTNGKGSSSHLIAAVLQSAGYKTGLYTSPHLRSFTERIKVNGKEISEEEVIAFVTSNLDYFKNFNASFFEITTLLAFYHFAKEQTDIVVLETGMGGRYDATNIVHPEACLITNVSLDHIQFLGDSIAQIAKEKAGVIKSNTPVIISEKQNKTISIFKAEALNLNAPLQFAEETIQLKNIHYTENTVAVDVWEEEQVKFNDLTIGLSGSYQEKNIKGVLGVLISLQMQNWNISEEAIRTGLKNVISLTGLKGRWQVIQKAPLVVMDTAHNEAGIRQIVAQLDSLAYKKRYIIIGFMKDKAIEAILSLFPKDAYYIFTMPNSTRALSALELQKMAVVVGLEGEVIPKVADALEHAKSLADKEDVIFVGGSNFVVAEVID